MLQSAPVATREQIFFSCKKNLTQQERKGHLVSTSSKYRHPLPEEDRQALTRQDLREKTRQETEAQRGM